jgi:tetratricopeptide (TPR) repeat protein
MSNLGKWISLSFTIYLLSCAEPVDWLERARTEFDQEDYLGAIVALNAHLASGDTSCDALQLRAASFRRVEKWRLAAMDLKRAEEKYPACLEARLEYARVLSDSGDTAGAHQKLIRLQQTTGVLGAEIQIELALMAYKQDRFLEAMVHLDNAINLDSSSHLAWYYRGYLQSRFTDDDHSSGTRIMELLDFDKAISDFSRCLALDSDFIDAWYQRGMVYLNQFNPDKGLADVARAIRLDPEYSYYYTGRAEYYIRENEFGNALNDLNKAIQLNPRDSLNRELRQLVLDSLKSR